MQQLLENIVSVEKKKNRYQLQKQQVKKINEMSTAWTARSTASITKLVSFPAISTGTAGKKQPPRSKRRRQQDAHQHLRFPSNAVAQANTICLTWGKK